MISSTLDTAVADLRANVTHVWASFLDQKADPPVTYELCTRCGRPKALLLNPTHIETPGSPEFLPCRGFVG